MHAHTISAAIHFDSHRSMSMVGLGVKSNESSIERCHKQMFSDCISVLVRWKKLKIKHGYKMIETGPLNSKKETTQHVRRLFLQCTICNHVQMQQIRHKCQQTLQQISVYTGNLVTAPIWQSLAFTRDAARISFIFTIYAMYYEFDQFEYKTDLTEFEINAKVDIFNACG